jgi:hypothetical protein
MGDQADEGPPGPAGHDGLGEAWADALGIVVPGVRGHWNTYLASYYDANGNVWNIDVETLEVTPVATATSGSCSAGGVYEVCMGALVPGGSGSRRVAPRLTFQIGSTTEVRVRDDTAPPPGGDCDACAILKVDTSAVTAPTLTATAPLHPVVTQ